MWEVELPSIYFLQSSKRSTHKASNNVGNHVGILTINTESIKMACSLAKNCLYPGICKTLILSFRQYISRQRAGER